MLSRSLQFLSLLLLAFIFVSCSGKRTPDYNPEVGPFDADGNYVEAWADNPPKRKPWSIRSTKKPTVASKPTPKPVPTPTPAPVIIPKPQPPVVSTPRPTPTPVVKPVVKPKPAPVKPKPAPTKPKPAPVKVVPKFKLHTVAKGDTLYSLGRKYGVSVREIQKANGLSGTNIGIGKSLKIPAK